VSASFPAARIGDQEPGLRVLAGVRSFYPLDRYLRAASDLILGIAMCGLTMTTLMILVEIANEVTVFVQDGYSVRVTHVETEIGLLIESEIPRVEFPLDGQIVRCLQASSEIP
jgi:hypothetical protein